MSMTNEQSHRWHVDDDRWLDIQNDEQCAMFKSDWWYVTATRCQGLGTHLVRHACVHEHVNDVRVCADCAHDLQRLAMFCNHCTDGFDSHECPVTTEVVAA